MENTCSPTLATTPVGSSPKIAGSGGIVLLSGVSEPKKLLTTRARLGTTPQALTSTNTSVCRGSGTSMRSSVIGEPYACSRAAIMVAMVFPPVVLANLIAQRPKLDRSVEQSPDKLQRLRGAGGGPAAVG